MRRGLFGGTFDPPHEAHLAVARAARDQLALDRVEIIPCLQPPHRHDARAPAIDRYAMIVLACVDEPGLVPSPREILRGGVSFTVETLSEIHARAPADELFLVLGADSYDDLPGWRDAESIVRLAHLAVAPRPGSRGTLDARPEDRARARRPGDPPPASEKALFALEMPELPYSASALREALGRGDAEIPGLSPALHRYIRERELYTPDPRVRSEEGGRT